MKRYGLMILFALMLVIFTLPVYTPKASASAPEQTQTSSECKHLQVYLHGDDDATSQCLDTPSSGTGVSPMIVSGNCEPGSLVLYSDTNYTGWSLCFKGRGATDLTSYQAPAPYFWYNWNDLVSSYVSGCSAGHLYSDIGQSGAAWIFNAWSRDNFDYGTWNDVASSVVLDSDC